VTLIPSAGFTFVLPSAGLIEIPVDGVFDAVGFAEAERPAWVLPPAPVPADWHAAASKPAAPITTTGSSLFRLKARSIRSTMPSSCLAFDAAATPAVPQYARAIGLVGPALALRTVG
jgi:hypothetical protein